MMHEEELRVLLRSTLRAPDIEGPSADLWPRVVDRMQARTEAHWVDIAIAAGIITLLALFPQWMFLLAYHL